MLHSFRMKDEVLLSTRPHLNLWVYPCVVLFVVLLEFIFPLDNMWLDYLLVLLSTFQT